MSIERFVESLPGRLFVAHLNGFINLITLFKYGGGKTALDTPKGTIIAGLLILGATLLAVRIAAAWVS